MHPDVKKVKYLLKIETSKPFFKNGEEKWRKANGQLHRLYGPAHIQANGSQYWYKDGQSHRDDGPAMIFPDGNLRWFKNGELHREDGPAMIYPHGEKEWWVDGKRHREDGPAVVKLNGTVSYYLKNLKKILNQSTVMNKYIDQVKSLLKKTKI
jgi:hypothetical protein